MDHDYQLSMAVLHQYDYIFAVTTIFTFLDAWNIGTLPFSASLFILTGVNRSQRCRQLLRLVRLVAVFDPQAGPGGRLLHGTGRVYKRRLPSRRDSAGAHNRPASLRRRAGRPNAHDDVRDNRLVDLFDSCDQVRAPREHDAFDHRGPSRGGDGVGRHQKGALGMARGE